MKTWIPDAAAIAVLAWPLAAAESVLDGSGNYLRLMDLPKDKLSTQLQHFVGSIKASKVPSKEEAVRAVLHFADDKPPYMRDARLSLKVVALYRVGREVPDFASVSDFMWVVHAEIPDGLVGVFHVSTGTAKVLSALPEASKCGASASQHEEVLRVPELDQLITAVHLDLLRLKDDHNWLSGYATNCLQDDRCIFFMPVLGNKGGPQPQQPDQLFIGYIPTDQKKGLKYANDLENAPACRFPLLNAKVYAHILVRGKDNAKTADAIRECIIRRCEALHKELTH